MTPKDRPHRNVFESPVGPRVRVDGRDLLWFGGTAYLGLQSHPSVIAAAQAALDRYGLHPGSARAGFGTTAPLLAAEQALAAFFSTEAAAHFASGWAATTVLLATLAPGSWRAFHDEHAHPSAIEALRVRAFPHHPFGHCDPDALRAAIARELRVGEVPLVVTDGVFAGTGRIAPLADYVAACAPHRGAQVCVDDAHGFGVLGTHGRGTAEHLGLCVNDPSAPSTLLVAGTASKGLGSHGGVFAARTALVERARAGCSWHAGSTPPPAPIAAATAAALEIARTEPARRERLLANTRTLKDRIRQLGVAVSDEPTPIIPIPRRDAADAAALHQRLRDGGLLVPVLCDYGGLTGAALRIAVFATHEPAHLDALIDGLRRHL